MIDFIQHIFQNASEYVIAHAQLLAFIHLPPVLFMGTIENGQTADADDFLTRGYGDGSDGVMNLDGSNTFSGILGKSGSTYTMLRDFYATNLTIGAGVTLVTDGFIFFVNGTLSGTGTISAGTSNVGGNASGQTAGAAATASTNGRFKTTAGGIGATGGAQGAAGVNSVQPTAIKGIGVSNAAGKGGDAGNGASGAAGVGANGNTSTPYAKLGIGSFNAFYGLDIPLTGTVVHYGSSGPAAGGGGGAGAGAGGAVGGGGGGGGASGGIVWGVVNIWAGSFTISAVGGAGGNGGNGFNGTDTGGGGGGQGGAGGVSVMIYKTKTWTGSYVLTGGVGGTKGNKGSGGSGTDGNNGSTGTTGTSYEIPLTQLSV